MASIIWTTDRHVWAALAFAAFAHGAGTARADHECVRPLVFLHESACTEADKAAAKNRNCTDRLDGTDVYCCCEPGESDPPPPTEECTPPTSKVHDGSCTSEDVEDALDGNCTDRIVNEETVCCCQPDKDAGGCNCNVSARTRSDHLMLAGIALVSLGTVLWRRSARRRSP